MIFLMDRSGWNFKAYVKLNSKIFLFVELFYISVWFSRKFEIFDFLCIFLNFQKNRIQKLSMLENKNKDSFGIYIKFRTKLNKAIFDLLIF